MRFFRAVPRVLTAQAADAGGLADLYWRAWEGCERHLDPRLVDEMMARLEEVEAWLRGGFEIYRVREEGRILAAVRCAFPASACVVDRLAVDPASRGQGLGRLLLEHALSRARRAGCSRVWSQVSPKLAAAGALYRRLGFREVAEAPLHRWGEPIRLLELRL